MRGPVPAYSAVYLFADGPDAPPCISRVDSPPGTPRGSPSARPAARPAPDTGSRRTYARRISFPSRRAAAETTIREDHLPATGPPADAAEGASESACKLNAGDRRDFFFFSRSTFRLHPRFISILNLLLFGKGEIAVIFFHTRISALKIN